MSSLPSIPRRIIRILPLSPSSIDIPSFPIESPDVAPPNTCRGRSRYLSARVCIELHRLTVLAKTCRNWFTILVALAKPESDIQAKPALACRVSDPAVVGTQTPLPALCCFAAGKRELSPVEPLPTTDACRWRYHFCLSPGEECGSYHFDKRDTCLKRTEVFYGLTRSCLMTRIETGTIVVKETRTRITFPLSPPPPFPSRASLSLLLPLVPRLSFASIWACGIPRLSRECQPGTCG